MARVIPFQKATYLANTTPLSKGQKALAEFINSLPKAKIAETAYPKKPFKVDIHDPNFNRPIKALTINYPI